MKVPIPLVPHLQRALQEEVSRLEEIGKSCGDDWPDDFDPNDIGVLVSMQKSLDNGDLDWGVRQGVEMYDGCARKSYSFAAFMGKSQRFTMESLPGYVQRNFAKICKADYNMLVHFYCEFKLRQCLENISNSEKYSGAPALAENVKRLASNALLAIEQFPSNE